MDWPLQSPPVPDHQVTNWSLYYLYACPVPSDPAMIWGTDVPMEAVRQYLARGNADSEVLISPAHLLLKAVALALAQHPEFNRRVLRRRLYAYRSVNLLVPIAGPSGPDIHLLTDADRKPLPELARELWQASRRTTDPRAARDLESRLVRCLPRFLRGPLLRYLLWESNQLNLPAWGLGRRVRRGGAVVNYLGHRDAPPMRAFKPSRFPSDASALSVTMGPTEDLPLRGPTAPIFVRADHRLVDALQLGRFVATLRRLLQDPRQMET